MNFNFQENQEFLKLLTSNTKRILERTKDDIKESDGFKILFAGLKSMLQNNSFNGAKVITISEANIIEIKLNEVGDFNALFANPQFAYNQLITLDKQIKIESASRKDLPNESNDARKCFCEMSEKGDVVFLLLKDKVSHFIRGVDKSESPFFSLVDVNRYNEKKNISEIGEVFSAYQELLKERKNYSKFFIELSHIKSLHSDLQPTLDLKNFISEYKHLLRNKPEDTFRDDLRQYLAVNLRITQVKEFLLENMRRLDIYLLDEYGEIYLIEIKWVGTSVHQNGKKVGTSYDENNINPAAFHQALDYLEELDNKGQNIVRAYLVVFDARPQASLDTGDGFDESALSQIQEKYYRKFEKVTDLKVTNDHPS